MERDLKALTESRFDLLIIGGGVYGVFAAWDAALRGLSVGLLEKGDFGQATSWNTLRIIHGGLRYLQHGDLRRMRQSINERGVFLRIAPHLVHPLPFAIPAYGHALRGREALALAVSINDLIGFDRNRSSDPRNHVPAGRVISRKECLRLFPGIESNGLTGAAIYHDCQMSSSERMVVSLARSASLAGSRLANYVEAIGFLENAGRVCGVRARDVLSGSELDVQARIVLNASGPWVDQVLGNVRSRACTAGVRLSKAFNVLVNRSLSGGYALGVYSKQRFEDRDALLDKGSRLFFLTPSDETTLIGTVHSSHDGDAESCSVNDSEIQTFLDDVNRAFPPAALSRDDVVFAYCGLLPRKDGQRATHVELAKRHRIYDHSKTDGIEGLISIVGVKFTEARLVAERAIDHVFVKLDKTPPRSTVEASHVHGGRIRRVDDFVAEETRKHSRHVDERAIRHLISRYGTAYSEVMDCNDGAAPDRMAGTTTTFYEAEVRHAARKEMAQKLVDVVFRRTALARRGAPEDACLRSCAGVMSREMGWTEARTRSELDEVKAVFASRT